MLTPKDLESLIALIPILPLVGAIINGLWGHRLPQRMVSLVACGSVLASFVLSAIVVGHLAQGEEGTRYVSTLYTWMSSGNLNVDISFVVDRLSAVMILVITGIGFLIHVYSTGYMSHEPAYARYFAYLNLFCFAMLCLVLGSSLPLLFLGWEGVGLCSYLLIGFWYTDIEKAQAGKKAFVVNRIGDFGVLIAMALLLRTTGSLDFEVLRAAAVGGLITTTVATSAALLLFLGATGKSAQLPLYVWLPDAMAGPTPVSALIHAATMVTAGVYLTARMGFLFSMAPIAMLTVAIIGACTALFAATIGTAQYDIKKVLAYSTVSQLGFMFIAAGVGAYAIALFHVITHAFFKACLFLGSGSVIHGMSGEQDMRQMGGLAKKMPITFATFFVSTLAITGFPLLSGFASKDLILWNAFISSEGHYGSVFHGVGFWLWLMGAIAAGFTAFYMWRLVFMTFFSGPIRASQDVAHHVHESPKSMTFPLVVLATLSVIGGALCWPAALGGHEWLAESWLLPVTGHLPTPEGHHETLEWTLMACSTGIAFLGFAIAFVLYARRIHPMLNRLVSEAPFRDLFMLVNNKWHIDELYDTLVVKPIGWVSRIVFYEGMDRRVIDGLVNLVGWFGRSVGFIGQLFQSGNVQRYLAIFALALALLLYGWLSPSAPQTEEPAAETPTSIQVR